MHIFPLKKKKNLNCCFILSYDLGGNSASMLQNKTIAYVQLKNGRRLRLNGRDFKANNFIFVTMTKDPFEFVVSKRMI